MPPTTTLLDTNCARPLAACMSLASYWVPNLILKDLAWLEHAPFGFWLVDTLRPKSIVELGCQNGLSYFVFCQAVLTSCIDAQCYAIGDWKDRDGQPRGSDDNFELARRHNDIHYHAFSKLMRSEAGLAPQHFEDGSVGLLHIEGARSYSSVHADFTQWRSKLSPSGIILFHGTNLCESGFDATQLWREIKGDYQHFEFAHGHGLGVLGIGRDLPQPLEHLFRFSSNPEATAQIRLAYSRLGMALIDRIHIKSITEVEAAKTAAEAKVSALKFEIGRLMKQQNYLSAVASELRAERADAGSAEERIRNEIRNEYINSTSWRITRPLRTIKQILFR